MSAIRNLADSTDTTTDSDNGSDAADSGEAASTSDGVEFYANETSDNYLTFGDGWAVQGEFMDEVGMETPDISVNQLTLGDLDIVLKKAEREGWEAQQAGWVVTGAAKSYLGDRQRYDNPDFGIGLNYDDGNLDGWYEGGYAEAFGDDLPTIEFERLTDDEVADLEAVGVDVDNLGYHPEDRARLPVIDGERLPVAFESMGEVEALVERLKSYFDPEPSLGDTPPEAGFDLVYDPNEGTIDDLEAFLDDEDPTEADIEAMLEAERAEKDRKGAKEALREVLEDDGGDDGESSGSKSRYAKAEDGDLDAEAVDATGEEAETLKEKAEAVSTLIEAGYSKDEARAMVFGE